MTRLRKLYQRFYLSCFLNSLSSSLSNSIEALTSVSLWPLPKIELPIPPKNLLTDLIGPVEFPFFNFYSSFYFAFSAFILIFSLSRFYYSNNFCFSLSCSRSSFSYSAFSFIAICSSKNFYSLYSFIICSFRFSLSFNASSFAN